MLAAATDFGPVLLALAAVLLAARLGGSLAMRFRQPAVVGEIVAGVLLGNLGLLGADVSVFHADALELLSEIGILILLFEVGVETTVPEMMRVGTSALLVGLVGVVVPAALGAAVSIAFAPDAGLYRHLFVGSILSATSVGLTARVLRDLDRAQTPEARLILGAAVIDDVLGLLLLAVVSGLVTAVDQGTSLAPFDVAWIVGKALLFFAVSIPLGSFLVPRLFRAASRLPGPGVLLTICLVLCFLLAYAASLVGLAPIVGAFTAGLILERSHLERLEAAEGATLSSLLSPVTTLFLPVFFVLIGMKVDVRGLADLGTLGLSAALFVAALVGKLACAVAVRPPLDRWTVAIGMVPRGEVGFVFAGIGTSLTLHGEPLISGRAFAAIVLVVIATTLVTPPLLARRIVKPPPRKSRKAAKAKA